MPFGFHRQVVDCSSCDNHTDYSQTDQSQNNQSYPADRDSERADQETDDNAVDAIRKREDYRRYFREELGIDELKTEYPSNAGVPCADKGGAAECREKAQTSA